MVIEPVTGWLPVQPPDAVQVWVFDEVHCRVAVLPIATEVLTAVNVKVGIWSVVVPPPLVLSMTEPPQAASAAVATRTMAPRITRSGASSPATRACNPAGDVTR